jgi:hypothetical protein
MKTLKNLIEASIFFSACMSLLSATIVIHSAMQGIFESRSFYYLFMGLALLIFQILANRIIKNNKELWQKT